MTTEILGLIGIAALMLLIVLRAPIGLSMVFVGLGGTWMMHGWRTVEFIGAHTPVSVLSSATLSVLPLFLLMGSLAVEGGMAAGLYRAASAFIGHRRGGLAIGTILACGGFGAICGSSMATVTTMTRVSIPEMERYGYTPQLAAGSVGAGGTLGILIPPSLLMILYAYLTETSVGRLFAAGVVPGIVAIGLYCAAIVVWMAIRPQDGPAQPRVSWSVRFTALRSVLSVGLTFGLIMGGIFFGVMSPSEGAAVGAAIVALIGVVTRKLGWRAFWRAVSDTIQVSAMVFLMLIGVEFFQYFMQASRLPEAIVSFFTGMEASRYTVLMLIILVLLVLGCFLDSIAIVLIMTPFLYPIITDLGFDLIWFGIIMVMVVEIGLMTPPFGINIFVINAMNPKIRLGQAYAGVTPFIVADFVRLAILLAFPLITLWLPNMLFN